MVASTPNLVSLKETKAFWIYRCATIMTNGVPKKATIFVNFLHPLFSSMMEHMIVAHMKVAVHERANRSCIVAFDEGYKSCGCERAQSGFFWGLGFGGLLRPLR